MADADPGQRPRTRGACKGGPRPCPFVRCRHHLGCEVRRGVEPLETCALDVADRGGLGLDEVAELLGVSRSRIGQIENRAMRKLGDLVVLQEWREEGAPRRPPRRRAAGAGDAVPAAE